MKRLAVIPNDPIQAYLEAGYNKAWLKDYYNPGKFFDEVYLFSPHERDNPNLLGMKALNTPAKKLKKRLKQFNIDLVRAYGGAWACEMAVNHKLKGIPVVVSVHDTNPNILHDSIKKADIVFCVSSVVKKLVLTRYNNPQNVWILPNRVNFNTMRPYPKNELMDLDNRYPFKYRILHVGRKTRQKNLDTLIKAMKILGDDYCLLAVGKGNDDEYRKLAQEQGVTEQCFFIDSIPNEELARYYSWSDCMCTPSRWEGFGMVFTEALACRAVVVTSDIAPMNEYITDGGNGLLVEDYENPAVLAETIKSACTDSRVRDSLKKNAVKSVEGFEKSNIDTLEAGYYEKILEEASGR